MLPGTTCGGWEIEWWTQKIIMIVVERDHKQTDDHYGIDSIILVIIAGVQCGWDLRRRNKIRLTASLEQGTKQTIQFCRSQQFWIGIIQPGVFFNCSSWFSEPKWKNDSANKELLILVLKIWGTAKNNTLYFWNSYVRQRSRISCLLQFLHNSEVGLSIKE